MFQERYRESVENVELPQNFEQKLLRAAVARRRRDARPRRALAVIVAAALLAGAAFAAVKLGALRNMLEEAGAGDTVLSNVQAVGVEVRGQTLRASIDEAIWEGSDLYASLTASVPDDGNTYLLAISPPMQAGAMVDFRTLHYLYYDNPLVYALGGGGPTEYTALLNLLPGDAARGEPLALSLEVALLRTDMEIVDVDNADYRAQIGALDSRRGWRDGEYEKLYTVLPEVGFVPPHGAARAIDLIERRDVYNYVEGRKAAYKSAHPPKLRGDFGFGPEHEEALYPGDLIGAQMLVDLGLGEIVDSATLTATVQPSATAAKTAKEAAVDTDAFTAKILEVEMTHFSMRISVDLFAKGDGCAKYNLLLPLSVDGEQLSNSRPNFWGMVGAESGRDGPPQPGAINYDIVLDNIFFEIPDRILLVPADYGSGGEIIYHMEAAIPLTLIDR